MARRVPRRVIAIYATLVRRLIFPYDPEAEKEMVSVFEDACEDGSTRRFWVAATATFVVDLLVTSASLWWRRERAAVSAGLLADVKVALRGLFTGGSFGVFVVASLALGIGANTAIFSVLHATLLRPLPLAHADRVIVPIAMRGDDPFQVSAFDFLEWKSSATTFDAFGLATTTSFVLDVDGEPERVESARITAGYLETLGVEPVLGRAFVEEDACCENGQVALLSYPLWQRAYGGSEAVLGESLFLDGTAHTVLGVMPPGIDVPFRTDLWVPFSLEGLDTSELNAFDYFAVLRLEEGASLEKGRAELRTIARRLSEEFPDTHTGLSTEAVTLRQHLLVDFEGRVAPALVALSVAVGLLLLVACANVSNLFLARSLGRSHELALRASLGAGRFQVTRHVLVEALVLSSLGGVAALALARSTIPLLRGLSPIEPLAMGGQLDTLELDGAVVVFTTAVTLVTGLALGFVSTRQISQTHLSSALRAGRGSRGSRRIMRKLVVAQVAIAAALAIGAGLTLSSLQRLRDLSFGFRPDRLWAVRLELPTRLHVEQEKRQNLIEEIAHRVRAVPGVEAAGVTTNLPADHLSWDAVYTPRGGTPFDPKNVPLTADRLVTAGYLETLGVELVSGRLLAARDRAGREPVVVVTRDFAERAWPGRDPVGQRVKRGAPDAENPWMTVVGVVEPVKEDRAAFRRDRPAWYVPLAQVPTDRNPILVFRSTAAGDASRQLAGVRRVIREVAPAVPVFDFVSLEAHLDELFAGDRFGVALLSIFGGLGLFLAALGVYGVLASTVESRRSEIGLRVALGADARRLARRFALEGLTLGATGTMIGVIAAVGTGRLVSGLLFDVNPYDPVILGVGAALGISVSIAASYGPARRVTFVDPVQAIRAE